MNHNNEQRNRGLRKGIYHALLILPAIVLGAWAMIHGGVLLMRRRAFPIRHGCRKLQEIKHDERILCVFLWCGH